MHHGAHPRHRITGREALAQARADQQVAFLDVRGFRHVAQFQVVGTAAAGDGAQPVAVHLHRHAVHAVGDQQDSRGIGHHLDHLAHQPAGVEHRLADEHAVARALVDDDALGEGTGVEADQFADDDLVVDQRGGVEQFAQAHVLLGERGQLLQTALQQQRLGLELLVFGDQLAAAGHLLAHAFPDPQRQIGQPVDRGEQQTQLAAHRLEGFETGIHHHQHDRQHGERQQAHTQRRAFDE